ncbi:hypothetical protein B4U79_01531 [Dinothrombium tinctorium]|uniref:Uncharacterized protein n=1 Tax=Dinothrombium tinctorium TaxID=1965070 RepID=A0A3S3PIS2_9ACAR|nr:hypothetical protein B4U79_07588 [Dinothrombium tinctorium]RWS03677.1 hypothetical protein B4U79_15033 [Dinothrombium tinctorium]RWS04033.1 hypothetical protein B4U79_03459 [Dinothrombium tinctorium]RWS04562.1 hypothetical protein B4U79_01531 [Dinothrombium tinctorium]
MKRETSKLKISLLL